MARMSAYVPVGEYRCDFHEFGCQFIAEDGQASAEHNRSTAVRLEHVRLMSNRLRDLQNRVERLEHANEQLQQEAEQSRAEISELKLKIAHLEAQSVRVCAIWELSREDLELTPSTARWENFQSDPHGYAFAVCSRLSLVPELEFVFQLRLRRTPHDRTLRWPFSGRVEIDIFPPDGFEQLRRPRTCVVHVPGDLTPEQRGMLERPPLDEAAESARSIEIQHPAGFSAEQLRLVPADSKFAIRFAILQ